MIEETQFDVYPLSYTVKVLSGVLCGAEFSLAAGRTLFVVGSEQTVASMSLPQDAIYLPGEDSEPNVEMILPLIGSERTDRFELAVLYGEHVEKRDAYLQQVVTIAELRFVVKRMADTWSVPIQSTATQRLPLAKPLTRPRAKHWGIALLMLLFVGGMVWGGFHWAQPTADSQMLGLHQILQGANQPYQIYKGRQGVFYVFAASEQDAAWARQALVHKPYDAPVRVLTFGDEVQRIAPLLDEYGVAWFTLRLDNPQQPVVLLSQDRNALDAQHQLQLQRWLLSHMPYATKAVLEAHADQDITAGARAGLDRLGVPYHEAHHPNSAAFTITGEVDDTALAYLQGFIQQFYQQWGNRYVHIVVELKDDWLKGKSFQYGSGGYVKLSPSHWYFPQPTH